MIKYGGMSHRIMLFAKMKGKPLAPHAFVSFAPKVFPKPYRVLRSMQVLHDLGFMAPVGPRWAITPAGVAHLYSIAKPYRGE